MKGRMKITRFAAILLISVLTVLSCSKEEKPSPESAATIAETPFVDSLIIELTGRDSVSVFDLLRESHQVDFMSSTMGVFVKGVDSVYPEEHASWMYSVNDSMGKIASDQFMTGDGDRVRWHLRRWTK